jgi:CDP-diacylglycerol--serine O-phosphatidyltransferase
MKKIKLRKKIRFPRKSKRLTHIDVLPSLITLMNGLCGFFAIILASKGGSLLPNTLPGFNISFFALAGYVIMLGMVADVMYGYVARISRSTSSFGAQLDSLCDAISFGIAPAFLMLKVVEFEIEKSSFMSEAHNFSLFYGRIIYLIAIIYAMSAIIRLARFNVENKDASHSKFAGLPSPAAAGTIVSIVVFREDFPQIINWHLPQSVQKTIEPSVVWGLPIVALIAGILMVSRIPYAHLMDKLLKGKKNFSTFLFALLILLLTIWSIQFAMVLGFCLYAVYGIIHWLVTVIRKPKKAAPAAAAKE